MLYTKWTNITVFKYVGQPTPWVEWGGGSNTLGRIRLNEIWLGHTSGRPNKGNFGVRLLIFRENQYFSIKYGYQCSSWKVIWMVLQSTWLATLDWAKETDKLGINLQKIWEMVKSHHVKNPRLHIPPKKPVWIHSRTQKWTLSELW